MEIAEIASTVLLKHGFEPAISFTLVTDRALVGVILLTYDREVRGEDERASACYRELVETLATRGCAPYRLGIQSMEMAGLNARAASLIRKFKNVVDEAHILAPTRYQGSGG